MRDAFCLSSWNDLKCETAAADISADTFVLCYGTKLHSHAREYPKFSVDVAFEHLEHSRFPKLVADIVY